MPLLASSLSSVPFSSPPQHQIYISKSTNPYFNLTLEDWLFRHAPSDTPLLLIYRDEPCIVIGRHQNPWKEINFPALRDKHPVSFIRRRSGGGTVYHDLGNTNFSIHLPRTSFDRHITAEIVVRAVRSLGVEAHVNGRNDICHISGSAYRIINKRAYHHGTMLISTDLAELGDLLRPTNKDQMVTKGVASVPSPVCNLQRFNRSITHGSFTDAVVNEFCTSYGIDVNVPHCVVNGDEEALDSIEYVRKGIAELSTWDWAFGQTPEFSYTIDRSFPWGDATATIHSKHGIILSCALQVANSRLTAAELDQLASFSKSLENKRYDSEEIAGLVGQSDICSNFGAWISQVTAA
ncbi:hypothetical protein M378DRAFT_183922 [Amanita muscaria Koide BX008]|uniref:Putative lipoate-protein ligase A n=1 Tax=Amanita muscaria (strain Koide BX008) TaxID=946122 RepID=A0A0C2TSZ0_AMAMK|nr:hypothetical protein M378DRAFT_183922 [Amanita muscaria Koide BX008]